MCILVLYYLFIYFVMLFNYGILVEAVLALISNTSHYGSIIYLQGKSIKQKMFQSNKNDLLHDPLRFS